MPQTLNLAPILIPIVALIIGWVIGFFDSNMRTQKKIKEAEQKADIAIAQAKDESQRAIQAAQAAIPAPSTDDSLLKLGIDQNNRPILSLDGQPVNAINLSVEQRKRLIDLMVTMRPWIEGAAAQKQSATSRPLAAQTPSLSRPIASTSPIQTPPTAASISQPLPTPIVAAPAISSKIEAAPTTMVGQIEAILQMRLIGTPLADQNIHLVESIQGNVNVMVGKQKYDGIADVPDAQIVAAIRAAVAEWEKKYTPGG